MGWWSDFWDKLGHIFAYLFNMVVTLVKLIADGLKYLRIKLTYALADWLGDESNWVIALAVLIIGAVLLPKIAEAMSKLASKIATSALLKYVKDEAIFMDQLRQLLLVQAMNDIAKILFPDYKEALNDLNAALSGIASELKLGAGYIHSYLAMTRGLVSGTAAIFGLPPESMEYDWYVKATDWAGKVEERLWRYTRNPEEIFSDIVEEIMLPMQADYTETQQRELTEIYDRIKRVEQIRDGFREIEQSFSTFISEMPEEIERVLNEKVGPYLADIRAALDEFDLEIWGRVTAVVDRLQKLEDTYKALDDKVANIEPNPLDLAKQHQLMSDREKSLFAVWLTDAIAPEVSLQIDLIPKQITDHLEDVDLPLPEILEEIMPVVDNSYDQARMFVPSRLGRFGGETWFVGDF